MKLGEALSLRARQAQQMKDLRDRLAVNAQAEKGTDPAENAQRLVESYLRLSAEHADLVFRIQLTNATTDIDGTTLLKLLQDRDHLIRTRNIYQYAADTATPERGRSFYGGSDKTYVPAIDVQAYRRLVEEENDRVRVIDAQIQETNWKTDLL